MTLQAVQKTKMLKLRFYKELMILGGVLAVLGAGGYFIQSWQDDAIQTQRGAEGEVNATRARLLELRNELQSSQHYFQLYDIYSKNHNKEFTLNREEATKWFVKQKDKFFLSSLSVSVSPIADLTKDGPTLKNGVPVKSDIKLTLTSVADTYVLKFVEAIQRELPGIVNVTDLQITKTQDLSQQFVEGLKNHRLTPLVKAEISIAWIGIRLEEKKPDAK